MSKHFPAEWRSWIDENRGRGCSEREIAEILLREGFDHSLILNETGVEIPREMDSILKDQVILGRSMELRHYWLRKDWIAFGGAREIQGDGMVIYTVDDFLSEEESAGMTAIIQQDNVPSTVTRENGDEEFRTSSSAELGNSPHQLVHQLNDRIARYMGISASHSEFIQGQLYEVGQQFKTHPDYFDDLDYEDHCLNQGQRTWTFMLYLNTPEKGGETVFPDANIKVKPKTGMAVFWNNLDEFGVRNPNAMHRGMPVLAGTKVIITKWFRQFTIEPAVTKEPGELLPAYTKLGWEKFNAPTEIHEALLAVVGNSVNNIDPEFVEGGYLLGHDGKDVGGSELIEASDEVKQMVGARLKLLAEKWSGVELKLEAVYGVRRYLEGASLRMHRDRNETHIVSVIVNVDQDVDEDWYLHIDNHFYRESKVLLKPGEMIFYEGAKLSHGRPLPLKGRRYENLFVHYSPA
ncbi:MAG: 2OG-Fe(II) oxygenase [Acidiferrobacterales bacterium]|nr:2OG-Fe(II) oxygenase [Acidiferrobacterales bacterium]